MASSRGDGFHHEQQGGKEGEEFHVQRPGGRRMAAAGAGAGAPAPARLGAAEFDATPADIVGEARRAMFADVAGVATGGEFFQDDEDVLRSVMAPPSVGLSQSGLSQSGLKAAPVYRHLNVARNTPVFSVGSGMDPTMAAFGKMQRMLTDMSVVAAAQKAVFTGASINPPALPPPPYPLERHAYGLSTDSGADDVYRQVQDALTATLVDADPVTAECRWECTVVSSGKHVRFQVCLHRAALEFVVEFQRRKGCSIVYNMAVSGVLKHIGKARSSKGLSPVSMFKRSEADLKVAPSKGFVVESFDIPEIPLDLSFSPIDFGAPLVVAPVTAAAIEKEVSDGVQVLLDMAASPFDDMAVEGTAGLAILSKPEGREALLDEARVGKVSKATAAAIGSDVLSVQVAGATLLANLTEDQRSHNALVKAGALDQAISIAQAAHTGATAHVRRECLRALVHLCGGPHRDTVVSRGGAACAATVPSTCQRDARMLISAQQLKQALGQ